MSLIPAQALVMVGDGEQARFLRNVGTPLEPKLQLEDVMAQHNPATRDQGTDHPTRGSKFGSGVASRAGAPRSNLEQADWHQINEDRFAKDMATRLYELAHAGRYRHLVIVVPPKALGALRQELHEEVRKRVVAEVPKEMTSAPVERIQAELSRILQ
jgi:protein required for attachment to host cells